MAKPKKKSKPPTAAELEERAAAAETAVRARVWIELLSHGTPAQKEEAAACFCLGGSLPCYVFCPSVISSPLPWLLEAIAPLVALLAPTCTQMQKHLASSALLSLASNPVNIFEAREQTIVDQIVAAGGISASIGLLREGLTDQLKQSAAGILQYCACKHQYRTTIALAGGAQALLVLARDGNCKQKEYAAMALGALCFSHSDNQSMIAKWGGVEILSSLAGEGEPLQKLAASRALQLLVGISKNDDQPGRKRKAGGRRRKR